MIGQGVSSRSPHSAAAGRTTPVAKPWTHSRMSRWSELSSSEKGCSVSVVVAMGSEASGARARDVSARVRELAQAAGAQAAVVRAGELRAVLGGQLDLRAPA